jgi:hypothetical protein
MTQAFNLALLANNVNSSGQLNADSGIYNTVNVANGGTNLSATPANGQLLIGDGTGYTLATLTASTGIGITNAAGAITITNTQPNATVDIQTFNAGDADLTWDKPTTGQTMARIQVWGGGGGGGRGTSTSSGGYGGGGGGYNEITVPISYLDTQVVTIGAAGVGRTGSTGPGTVGGTSSFAINATGQSAGIRATIAAYGGGGGGTSTNSTFAGTGGGQLGAGVTAPTNSTPSAVYGGSPLIANGTFVQETTGYGGFEMQGGSILNNPLGGIYHGASGGGNNPGSSIWGGGGGPGTSSAVLSGFGVSLHGGSGNYRAAGSTPAGGGAGGYGNGINGYNGGAGRIIVTSW